MNQKKKNKIRIILARYIYESEYSALTDGYKLIVDSCLKELLEVNISEKEDKNEKQI